MANHIYGLSGSGIDVDSMVKSLMQAARAPYNTLWQKEQRLEWQKAEYNTIYTNLNDFQTNTVFNYTLQKTLLPQSVSSSSTSVATATATADAANVNHSLTVTQLAAGVTVTSNGNIGLNTAKSTLDQQLGAAAGTLVINGKTINYDPATQSISDLVSNINNAGAGVKANYDATLGRFFLYTTNTGASTGIDFTGSDANGLDLVLNKLKLNSSNWIGTSGVTGETAVTMATGKDQTSSLQAAFGLSSSFNLKLNGTTITIDPTSQSLDDVVTAINTAAGGNASASYDAATGKFTLKAASGTLSLAGSDQAALNFLSNNLNMNIPASSGQDAKFTLDGASLTKSTNNFTVSGVTYNLQSVGSTNVSVTADIDKIVASVKSFIDSYNTVLAKLNDETSQTVYSDYLPLTDDQKTSMKDSEISAWTAKAKSGLLHNDSILQDAINGMRNNMADPIAGLTGKYTTASSIGIATKAYAYNENGKLYVDEDKLRAALQEDPTIVNKIFGSTGTSTSSQGLAVRLNNTLKNAVSQIKTVAGTVADTSTDTTSNLALRIKDYNTQLYNMNNRLNDLQDRYYTQYDAMESALQKLTQQSSWLSQFSAS